MHVCLETLHVPRFSDRLIFDHSLLHMDMTCPLAPAKGVFETAPKLAIFIDCPNVDEYQVRLMMYYMQSNLAIMMTSSNTFRKYFPRYGLLLGESIGHWWNPLTKASDAELWWFLWCAPEQTDQLTFDILGI